jgi:restriction endonuclease S subunit
MFLRDYSATGFDTLRYSATEDAGRRVAERIETTGALLVKKEKLAENGEYNLTGDRYRAVVVRKHQKWPMVELGTIVDILDSQRRPITKHDRKPGPYPYYGATGVLDYVDEYLFDEPLVLVGEDGAKWGPGEKTAYAISGKTWVNNHAHVLRPIRERLMDVFLIVVLNTMDLSQYITGVTVPKLNQEKLRGIQIPLPPIEVQREIVAEIEGYQKLIDGCRQVVDSWKPDIQGYLDEELKHYLDEHPERRPELVEGWPMVKLGEVCDVISGQSPEGEYYNDQGIGTPFYQGKTEFTEKYIGPPVKWTTQETKIAEKDDILMSVRAPVGPVNISTQRVCIGRGLAAIRVSEKILVEYLFRLLKFTEKNIKGNGGAVFDSINRKEIEAIQIPLPPIEVQQKIVAKIEAERKVIDGCRELIKTYEDKIKRVIDKDWED